LSELEPEGAPDLDVHEVEDGLVIYDLATERVHYLNETAAIVFVLCTGTHDEEKIAELVGAAWKLEAPPREAVEACLGQLRGEGLIR
jgi:Coenzyme PQQ synthesis protein D (PqqD)